MTDETSDPTTPIPATEHPGAPVAPAAPAETQTMVAEPRSAVVEPVSRPLRMRTVVLGVILLAVAVLSLIDTTTSMNVDLGTTVLALMIGCGVLLIVGARRE